MNDVLSVQFACESNAGDGMVIMTYYSLSTCLQQQSDQLWAEINIFL